MPTLDFQKWWYSVRPVAKQVSAADIARVRRIHERTAGLERLSERELADRGEQLRDAVADGAEPTSDDVLLDAFSLVIEAARRVHGVRLFDVQLLASLSVARGQIAEMATGEGKTFAALPAVFVRSLARRGAHVATVNSYLARRDFEQMKPVLEMLGATVGLIDSGVPNAEKTAAYACDVTYGTGYEFGFDYLRDQQTIARRGRPSLGTLFVEQLRRVDGAPSARMQREHAFVLIDEIDSVLIDEARTPLIISDPQPAGAKSAFGAAYQAARAAALRLEADRDFQIDPAAGRLQLRPATIERLHADSVNRPDLRLQRPWRQYVEFALQAERLLHRDVAYVVQENEVRIVDEFTGRVMPERRWQEGLHQAVEVKEGLPATLETGVSAKISRQRFYLLYEQVAGMTGTARGCEREFWEFYRLPVVSIPLRCPSNRRLLPTRFFAGIDAKLDALVEEVADTHATGRPVLIGTRTIANSEQLADRLQAKRLPFQLLNGKQDGDEAAIVAAAGRRGAITIATNMAGRGTDIKLEAGVNQLGGLHVIGMEPHECERIDRQLAGRAGRQGNNGSSRYFASAEDALFARFAPQRADDLRVAAESSGETSAETALRFARNLRRLQTSVEREQFERRRDLLRSDARHETVLAQVFGAT